MPAGGRQGEIRNLDTDWQCALHMDGNVGQIEVSSAICLFAQPAEMTFAFGERKVRPGIVLRAINGTYEGLRVANVANWQAIFTIVTSRMVGFWRYVVWTGCVASSRPARTGWNWLLFSCLPCGISAGCCRYRAGARVSVVTAQAAIRPLTPYYSR